MQQPSLEEIFGSYMAWKLDDTTWCINFMNGTQNLYLLEGEEKALLLDTGYGTGTLRAFVERLTKKVFKGNDGNERETICKIQIRYI